MQVASNKLKDSLSFFYNQLSTTYDASEIKALFETACDYYLNFNKTQITTNLNNNINQSDLLKLYNCCKDLKKNIPIQYILKHAWFYNLQFKVDASVLIPRPETEELVDIVLKENPTLSSLLDIGTGSGCIPISIKKNRSAANVFACDISNSALQVATQNAIQNNCTIHFFKTDILNPTNFNTTFTEKVNVIVSNPPYIKISEKNTLHKNVLDNEPHLALFVKGNDPILFYKKIIDICKTHLNTNGILYFELNNLTANDVKNYAENSKQYSTVVLLKDINNNIRFLKAIKN